MSKTKLIDTIGQFTTIPNTVIALCPKIGSDGMTLFVYLRYRTNHETGEAFPSLDTICTETGLTRRRAVVAARSLVKNDLLDKRRRFSGSTVYTLKMPSISTPAAPMDKPISTPAVPIISAPAVLPLVQQVSTNQTDLNQTDLNQRVATTSDLFAIIDTYLHQTMNGTYSKIQPVLKIDESPNVITIGVSIPQPSLKAAISSLVAQSSRKKWQVKVVQTPAAVTGDNLAAADKARQPYKVAYETAKRGPYNWTREHDELIDALIARQCTPAGLQFTYSKLSKDQFWAGKVIPFSVIVNNYTTPPAVRPAQPEQCYV